MMDPKLTTFIHVARLKSYTRAAELLNLTQPAVTQHIKQLEAYYSVELIIRKGRQLLLTSEGELLLKYARELESNSLLLERTLKNKSAVIKRYNIGATLTIGEFVLPYLLGEYKRLHNNMDVILQVHNSEEILKRLGNGEYDLGIVEGPFDKEKFRYKKMKDDELVLVAAAHNSFSRGGAANIADVIQSGKLILREKGSGTRTVFENRLLELGYKPSDIKTYMEIGSIGAIKSLVEANLGYTIISKAAVKRELESGTLAIIPIRDIRIMREFNFIYLDNRPTEFTEDFMSFLTIENQDGL